MKRTKLPRRPQISADGDGVANHAGSLLVRELADRLGLTGALSRVCAPAFRDVRTHDPGMVLRDLAVMIADGGDCLSHLCTLRDQPDLFGSVASHATAWRVIDRLEQVGLPAWDAARAEARRRAWAAGLQPKRITLDLDSTLVTAHSEKEGAAPTYKRGFGFHPLLCTLDETQEVLAGILRPGNATANHAADTIAVLDAGLAQLPTREAAELILVRSDSAGATHELVNAVRERELRFSIGFDLTAVVRDAILALPAKAWTPALRQDGEQRDGADVAELTALDLHNWPVGTRAICRREIPHLGAQLTFSDLNGHRFQVFITDQPDADIAYLEARHRGHARVEDRIRCAKDTGLRNLPLSAAALPLGLGFPVGHIVPTGLTFHNDSFYLTNLDVFDPGFQDQSRVFRITRDGGLRTVAGGLNAAVAVAFDRQGRLYALEAFTGFFAPAPSTVNTGMVVCLNESGGWDTIASA